MIRAVLFILLLLPAVATTAQEEFITPAQFITRMPFRQMTGGVILLKARLNSFPDSLNFILDTGSGGISLDSTTVEYFKLKPEASNRTIRGIAGIRNVSFLYNQQLHFPGMTVDSLNFHVNDYSILTAVYGEQIDGIIGYSVLNRYILKINFDSTHVEFWTRGTMKYPRGGYLFRPFISTLPVQAARVRDEQSVDARFLYDMGAGLNMLLTTDFIEDSSLLSSKRKLWVKEAEGLGGKIDMHMTVVKEVKLGPYKFRNVPVYVFDDAYNVTSYPYMGGLIGNDLLRRFNVVMNYEKRHFHLTPNSHFADPFDYSYSGVELYYMDGEIILGDVAKGSPAEKAGLKEGDVVVAVNRNFTQSLQLMKAALQNTNGTVRMIIRRDGELMDFDFKVKNIMRH